MYHTCTILLFGRKTNSSPEDTLARKMHYQKEYTVKKPLRVCRSRTRKRARERESARARERKSERARETDSSRARDRAREIARAREKTEFFFFEESTPRNEQHTRSHHTQPPPLHPHIKESGSLPGYRFALGGGGGGRMWVHRSGGKHRLQNVALFLNYQEFCLFLGHTLFESS